MLKKREKSTIDRVAYVKNAANVIEGFLQKGFSTLPAVTSITQHYYPEVSRTDVHSLWNFRSMNTEVLTKMEKVLEQLKSE